MLNTKDSWLKTRHPVILSKLFYFDQTLWFTICGVKLHPSFSVFTACIAERCGYYGALDLERVAFVFSDWVVGVHLSYLN